MAPPQDSARRRQHRPQPQAPWVTSDASASSAPTAYEWTQEDLDNYRYAHNRVKTWRQEAFTGRSPQYRHPLSSHLSSPPRVGAELDAVLATQRRARDASAKIQRGLSKRTPLDAGPSPHRSSAPSPAQLSRSQSSRRPAPVAVLAQAPSSPLPQNVPLPRSDHLPLSSAPTAQWSQREAYLNDALSPPLEFLSDTLPEDPMHATTDRPSGLARVGSFLSRTRSTISRRSSQESLAKAPPPSAFPKAPAVSQPPDVLVMTRSNSVNPARGSSRSAKLVRSQSSSAATKNNNSREYAQHPRPTTADRGGGSKSAASKVSATAAPVLPELSFDPILPTTTQSASLRSRLRRFRK
ncbi:uncharacterized protein LOC62_02G002788 [Vanrija pseudolonga]|uniref:Uncharacterized protein n=1 Tax=Vanrija pseudolonga TaxID=143232 RepID=A0AAF1BIY2_9TREE|nr:hypothetical protein LOC62_02G002788 [Vanrija pseudolonga]